MPLDFLLAYHKGIAPFNHKNYLMMKSSISMAL